jgi:predicted ArsR family transcriptional regulator
MDLEPQILEFLKERGPVTVKCISKRLGLPRNLVRGALWHSKHAKRTDRAPSCRRKRPVWSFSEARERPDIHKVSHLVLHTALEEHEDEDH